MVAKKDEETPRAGSIREYASSRAVIGRVSRMECLQESIESKFHFDWGTVACQNQGYLLARRELQPLADLFHFEQAGLEAIDGSNLIPRLYTGVCGGAAVVSFAVRAAAGAGIPGLSDGCLA